MILVLADDLSGAAELGGVGARFGLAAEVRTAFDAASAADLVVVDTDTRPEPADVAAQRTRAIGAQAARAGPDLLFKKIDSVFRGPVLPELEALLETTGRRRALVVGGNPSLGRIIRNGRYYIDDVPLNETAFRVDPEYPARSADVNALLGTPHRYPLHVLPPEAALPESGIIVGEAGSEADVAAWAARVDAPTLPAGAAAFFSALLRQRGLEPAHGTNAGYAARRIDLFVIASGSPGNESAGVLERSGVPVIRLPGERIASGFAGFTIDTAGGRYTDALLRALETSGRAALAVARDLPRTPSVARRVRETMASIVSELLPRRPVAAMLVEGGSTGSTLVRRLGMPGLVVLAEAAPGVVWLQPAGPDQPLIVTKPGSYKGIDRLIA